ncbi:amidase [Streptomyces rapamycinicus]|uniref:Amidase n=2 Tax=Streptomyces rapamycinicus TaxID=1226757 RepID=A0A0A0N9H8_STRRN|nr:amidase [Streptomyces rapamycinicus]AGP53494.1 amidase [Streptomyces rapamycinicus NRRL 5491]MBB4780981.1 Asp-tRNA(Asn)/Glu-tRNA(Gln) amidotransferase A subunit family amidase [Streptomyces rapamycinicus]RLV74373.1 amidase [Streptomyces rapamycinicus NRRL 5491]UTO61653.1 amidase [Streptomyces rapamycinicus]UTP29602.1 amidase [Streptomyces rapamycinicus NRRL 5491]
MDTSCATAAAWTCDRIEAGDGEIQAFVPEPGRRERLARAARVADERWREVDGRPPLYGVMVGVKDNVRVEGLPTRAGSDVPAEVLAGAEASLVGRLREAGALVAGKTVTAEFAVTAPGPTRNPRHPGHTPGGSSSGSAAAVAAGMVPLAVGTQTIGSMIRPAAYCGVVGFKPTHGRIPSDGVIPNAPTFDTVGLFAPDVATLAPAAVVLCDGWRPSGGGETSGGGGETAVGRRPVLGVPLGPYLDRADAEARDSFEERAGQLEAAGFTVRRVPFPDDFERVVAEQRVINRYELARTHAVWFPRHGERYREQTAAAIREGQRMTHDAYAAALRARAEFRERLVAAMDRDGIDLWITPAATGPAPYGLQSTGNSVMSLPWSYAGTPALALPAGRAANSLPLGVQCVARPGADERLLGWAPDVESVLVGTSAPV